MPSRSFRRTELHTSAAARCSPPPPDKVLLESVRRRKMFPTAPLWLRKNAMFCVVFFASLAAIDASPPAVTAADSGQATAEGCSKCDPSPPRQTKDKNSSSGLGVIRTIRAALQPDREGVLNANIYRGVVVVGRSSAGTVVTAPAPAPVAAGWPSSSPPTPSVISYATMAS